MDPYRKEPAVRTLRAAIRRGDWPAIESFFAQLADPDEYATYTRIAAETQGTEDYLHAIVRQNRMSDLALLLYGARSICWAWEGRTAAAAAQVSNERWQKFFDRLHTAEATLGELVRRTPGNAHAWAYLVTTSRGLEFGIPESRRRFERAVAVHPTHLYAHRMMLTQLCAKWGGSHEAMLNFARESLAKAPPGSAIGALVPEAHIEHHMSRPGASMTLMYLKLQRQELLDAAHRSVLHPDFRPSVATIGDQNMFAAALSLAGAHRAAATQFRALRGRYTSMPWGYFSGSPGALARSRRIMGLVARPFVRN